jgi:hypothetical protein
MTNYLLTGFVGLLILAAIVIPILVATGFFKNGSVKIDHKGPNTVTITNTDEPPFIDPTPFQTGYLQNSPQPLADLCNSTMYPVQPLYVEYGEWNGGDCCNGKCDVNIFNSAP